MLRGLRSALGLSLAGAFSSLAWSAEPAMKATDPLPVKLSELRRLAVTTRGQVLHDETIFLDQTSAAAEPRGGGCQEVAQYTDASFTGGEYVAQAGFGENEIAAVSYVLPPDRFPLRLEQFECVFVTAGAVVQTTTEWSLLIWEGTPDTGTLIASFESDGSILPHAVVGPGNAGVNLQIIVDPTDPEQIVISNLSGTNTFSIGYRIDKHHQAFGNPCFDSPDPLFNAFPTTDVNGLAFSSRNWLFGLNCGQFGCPPNGGWARFSALTPLLCRPTGDWVMRAYYSPTSCQPGLGACCLTSGACEQLLVQDCSNFGGLYQGDGVDCVGVVCPAPSGACCFESTGGCINLTSGNCAGAGGVYLGNGSSCQTSVCFPEGACCLPTGACIGPVSPGDCDAAGGVFQGDETVCGSITCPLPVGSCCINGGFCLDLTQADCAAAAGVWGDLGSACEPNNQCPSGVPCGDCGDANCDGSVTVGDIAYFVEAVTNGEAGWSGLFTGEQGLCDYLCANDASGDGTVSVSDIAFFVQRVTGEGSCGGK